MRRELPLLILRWRQNGRDGVSNHQPHDCLFNRLWRRRSKTTSKLRVTGLCVGNSPAPVNSPHKGPVTRKMFLFDDVIMPMPVVKRRYAGEPQLPILHSDIQMHESNYTTIEHIYNISTHSTESYDIAFDTNDESNLAQTLPIRNRG